MQSTPERPAIDAVLGALIRLGHEIALNPRQEPKNLRDHLIAGTWALRPLIPQLAVQNGNGESPIETRVEQAPIPTDIQGVLEIAGLAARHLSRTEGTDATAADETPPTNSTIAIRLSHKERIVLERMGPLAGPPLTRETRSMDVKRSLYIELDGREPELPNGVLRVFPPPDALLAGARGSLIGIWTSGQDASWRSPLVVTLPWPAGDDAGMAAAMRLPTR